ncbi:hypothetical protein [Heyndrickxia acidicola]|uniref:Uncharacterized protein n=1 Tax=Heyndrickxia acidicola TaxID=209389 RepID=A0ABU6ME52_9BACI|nr:hypothetical protein [Heyndrickxia acidicola]MED1202719.1 hypothetical protein [Heyndrickxia acidicola]
MQQTKVNWRGRYETPAGSTGLRETLQELATRRLPAARGKRVPAAEINPAGRSEQNPNDLWVLLNMLSAIGPASSFLLK